MVTVDLNADIGEGLASDEDVLGLVSSASISCGAHAGDDRTMRRAIEAALTRGVAVGAHPGYPDRESFGRRETGALPSDVFATVQSQLEAFARACADVGAAFAHVKPHGALYNRAQLDREMADSVVQAIAAIDSSLLVFGMPGGELLGAATAAGLPVAGEAFLDRAYHESGSLLSRRFTGAVITDPEVVADRAQSIVISGTVGAIDGTKLALVADTLCVHGDNPAAVALLRAARVRLEERAVLIAPPRRG